MYYSEGNLCKLVEETNLQLDEAPAIDPYGIYYTVNAGTYAWSKDMMPGMETISTNILPKITTIVDQVLAHLGDLALTAWNGMVTSIEATASYLSSQWWALLTTYWFELLIAAAIVAAIAWIALRVKRWWDGTSVIESRLKKQQKEVDRRLKKIESQLAKMSNDNVVAEIKKTMMKETDYIIKKQEAMFDKLEKKPEVVAAVANSIGNMHVNAKGISKLNYAKVA